MKGREGKKERQRKVCRKIGVKLLGTQLELLTPCSPLRSTAIGTSQSEAYCLYESNRGVWGKEGGKEEKDC